MVTRGARQIKRKHYGTTGSNTEQTISMGKYGGSICNNMNPTEWTGCHGTQTDTRGNADDAKEEARWATREQTEAKGSQTKQT